MKSKFVFFLILLIFFTLPSVGSGAEDDPRIKQAQDYLDAWKLSEAEAISGALLKENPQGASAASLALSLPDGIDNPATHTSAAHTNPARRRLICIWIFLSWLAPVFFRNPVHGILRSRPKLYITDVNRAKSLKVSLARAQNDS